MPVVRPMAHKHWGKAGTRGIAPARFQDGRRGEASPHIERQSRCKGLLGQSLRSLASTFGLFDSDLTVFQASVNFSRRQVLIKPDSSKLKYPLRLTIR